MQPTCDSSSITLTTIQLLEPHLQAIRAHAESTYPEECCGLILGTSKAGKMALEVLEAQNSWDASMAQQLPALALTAVPEACSKRRRYAIAPEFMVKAQKIGRGLNLEIIGIYHSHTDNPAIPSQFDLACAWAQYSYIIVSVLQGKACDLLSWCLNDKRQFQSETVVALPAVN